MNEWVSKWVVSEWVSGGEWVNEWVSEWVTARVMNCVELLTSLQQSSTLARFWYTHVHSLTPPQHDSTHHWPTSLLTTCTVPGVAGNFNEAYIACCNHLKSKPSIELMTYISDLASKECIDLDLPRCPGTVSSYECMSVSDVDQICAGVEPKSEIT